MNFIAWMIVACEIAFWVVIGLGLVTRYIFKQQKAGLFLLALTPVVDVILLIITGVDLYRGASATTAHALAAVYIGVSIAFGKSMIQWADEKFQHYFSQSSVTKTKRYGLEHARHYAKSWFKHLLAFVIGVGILLAMIYFVNDSARTEALSGIMQLWTVVLGIDLVIAISYFIWPRKGKSTSA
ncbi:hypothetical protein [Brevibacillus reuszeri]|uniref:hypothetical protein n=1 Tax=Brevibacillus reuszeri TaxID=54915 RepID=UPI000CCC3C16|nr:hypothetical protein [Brevibacillus reuszeri]